MQKFSLNKGFTLIELLVVIAILGILAAVVLIAINPAERIAEANDTQVRSDISTVASAIEACFTSEATGVYTNCASTAALTDGEFLKSAPQSASSMAYDLSTDDAELIVSAPLEAASAHSKASCTSTQDAYYTYDTTDGSSEVLCGTAAPVLP